MVKFSSNYIKSVYDDLGNSDVQCNACKDGKLVLDKKYIHRVDVEHHGGVDYLCHDYKCDTCGHEESTAKDEDFCTSEELADATPYDEEPKSDDDWYYE